MAIARHLLVDRSEPGIYHCTSRCVRRAFLCGDGHDHRRDWIRDRLRELSEVFAIDVCGYAVMSNHLHVILRTDPALASRWSALEVAERWNRLYPKSVQRWTRAARASDHGSSRAGDDDEADSGGSPTAVEALAADESRIAALRDRLSDLSWFMKCLKEPIARRANREDGCTGCFWESRFKCQRLLDDGALLACLVYVDLNVIRAGLARTPEASDHTSVQDRIHARQHFRKLRGKRRRAPARATRLLTRLEPGGTPASAEDGIWLAPIEHGSDSVRSGMLPMSLDEYLEVVDLTGRLCRADKPGSVPVDLPPILERLDLDTSSWVRSMRGAGRLFGTAVGSATSRATEAMRRGSRWVVGTLDVFADERETSSD